MEKKLKSVKRLRVSESLPFSFMDIIANNEPVILEQFASNWEFIKQSVQSDAAAIDYLRSHYSGKKFVYFEGAPTINGKFGYNADCTDFNFSSGVTNLDEFVEKVLSEESISSGHSYYLGSSSIDLYFPGFRESNDLSLHEDIFAQSPPTVSIWIGNRTTAAAHYDASHNIAVCAAGQRRFTLFPPNQIENLYPGPVERNPGGQVISLVDFSNPDFSRFPNFAKALDNALVADLLPGDVLVYPSMWWHQVEAKSNFNVLVNYWWNSRPDYIDSPSYTLLHGLMSLRGRGQEEKLAWKAIFDYYLFSEDEKAFQHIPLDGRGILENVDEIKARMLRSMLLKRLNR